MSFCLASNLLGMGFCCKILNKFLAKTARSSNGRTAPSGGVYLGSNPSLAVLVGNKEQRVYVLFWGK